MIKLTTEKSVTHEEISHYAYLLWEADGKPDGKDKDYWVKAETILYSSASTKTDSVKENGLSKAPAKAPRKKSVRASATTTASKAKKTGASANKPKSTASVAKTTAKAGSVKASAKKKSTAKTPSKTSKKKKA